MAHHSLIWPSGLTDGLSTIDASELEQLDTNQAGSIDGDAGGAWSPAAAVVVNGAYGVQAVFTALKLSYTVRKITDANYTVDASGTDVLIAVATIVTPLTMTMPVPVLGRVVGFKDVTNQCAAYPLTLARHDPLDSFDGQAGDLVLSHAGAAVWVCCTSVTGATGDWSIVGRG